MKTNRLFCQPLVLVCLAVALGSIPPGLDAQEKSRSSPPQPAGASPAPGSPAGTAEQEAFRRRYGIPREGAPSAYTLEIMDGKLSLANLKGIVNVSKRSGPGASNSVAATLANIIDVLRDLHADANITMSPELANVQIADLKLRTTSLDEELEALRVASGNQFIWTKPGAPPVGTIDPTTGLPVAAVPASEFTLYSLVPAEFGGPGPTKRDMEVFNLGSYLVHEDDARSSVEQIEKIILNTLSQLKQKGLTPDENPDFQFHAGANLLIVIGRQDALEVARKVVTALQTQTGGGGGGGFGGGGVGFGGPMPYVPNVAFRTSKERQNILNKLENIRLDSILYDGLLLPEVVRNLGDEAKKRDPEKKGVNFLVNPNPPAAATRTPSDDPAGAAAAPVEAVDINSISIRINPALTNLRLVDVLEAIVRVADRPIKYSVTDYAVVFSLAANEAPTDNPWVPGNPPGARPAR